MGDKISSIIDLFDRFGTEEDCVRHLYGLRTEGGWECPRCGADSPSLLLSRRKTRCTRCSHQEAVTAGTAMERSHIPLRKWFLAIYLVANDKRGVSASFLAHELRVQWRSAHCLLGRRGRTMREAVDTVLGIVIVLLWTAAVIWGMANNILFAALGAVPLPMSFRPMLPKHAVPATDEAGACRMDED